MWTVAKEKVREYQSALCGVCASGGGANGGVSTSVGVSGGGSAYSASGGGPNGGVSGSDDVYGGSGGGGWVVVVVVVVGGW